jgi:hypothetical protein
MVLFFTYVPIVCKVVTTGLECRDCDVMIVYAVRVCDECVAVSQLCEEGYSDN